MFKYFCVLLCMIIRINISLPEELFKKAKKYSKNSGRTISGLLGFLLEKWLKEEDFFYKKDMEDFSGGAN